MPQRLRLYDCRNSRLPSAIGICKEDVQSIANYVNSAQRRLLMAEESGDEGWWGTWAEILFSASTSNPYLTMPRSVARLIAANVCEQPVSIENQFYEYLNFGNGRLPKTFVQECNLGIVQGFTRNNAITFIDLPTGPQTLRIYSNSDTDDGKRVLVQGTDSNDKVIYTQDGLNKVTGVFATLAYPFVDCGTSLNSLTGLQKDVTDGEVTFYAVDPTTGDETLIHYMEPSETTASYRRYYFDSLPTNCCGGTGTETSVTITGICKLDLIPVICDTDYCLIQNLEAIIAECQSIRYSEQDGANAKMESRERHKAAVKMLNGELAHYLGTDKVALSFAPFGTAALARKKIGTLI